MEQDAPPKAQVDPDIGNDRSAGHGNQDGRQGEREHLPVQDRKRPQMQQTEAHGRGPHGRNDVFPAPVLPLPVGCTCADQPEQDGSYGCKGQEDVPDPTLVQVEGTHKGQQADPERDGRPLERQAKPEHQFLHERCV